MPIVEKKISHRNNTLQVNLNIYHVPGHLIDSATYCQSYGHPGVVFNLAALLLVPHAVFRLMQVLKTLHTKWALFSTPGFRLVATASWKRIQVPVRGRKKRSNVLRNFCNWGRLYGSSRSCTLHLSLCTEWKWCQMYKTYQALAKWLLKCESESDTLLSGLKKLKLIIH